MITQKLKIGKFSLPLWLWVLPLLILSVGVITFVVNQPREASWRYGVCKAFLQGYTRFPGTIDIKVGGESRGTATIGYADVNPFGLQQMKVMECHYSQNADGSVRLSKITIDRKSLPEEIVKPFSAMLPVLLNTELDNTLPKPLPQNLKDLKG